MSPNYPPSASMRESWRRVSWVDRPLAIAIWRNKEGGMGMQTAPHTQPIKKKRTNKLVLGFAAVVASAIVGTTGFVAATGVGNSDKPTKEQCAAAGFKNYGQCVKEWAHHKNHPGGGYGGGGSGSTTTNVTANVGVEVNGNNNVINVIINLFR